MSYRVEYKRSGSKVWMVIFAPVWLLLKFASFLCRPIIGRIGPIGPHIDVPCKKGWDED